MKWLSAVMCVLFVAAAAVQYNDPDPLQWMAVYLLGASSSGLAAVRRCPAWLAYGTLGAFGLWALFMLPAVAHMRTESVTEMSNGSMRDEEAREAVGLLIGAVWSAALVIWNRSADATPSSPPNATSEHQP